MQKISTPLKKTDSKQVKLRELEPSEATLSNILKFASAYRAVTLENRQYVNLILN